MKRIVLAALLWSFSLAASAQTTGRFAWQTTGDRLKASQTVSALGPNFPGDEVSLSNGALSFHALDVSLPGNGTLDVVFARGYSVQNRKDTVTDEMLADWSVQLPSISGVFATDWVVPGSSPGDRCSDTSLPPLPGGGYIYTDYWQGLSISLPGGGGGDLQAALSTTTKPTTGGPYPWVAENGAVHLSCLASIKNGTGQGFLAILPDGTKVWYDWMAQHYVVRMKGNQVDVNSGGAPLYALQERRRNVLYATRVEDRFGNYVTYTYSNAWNAPGKLTQIQASDGRQLTINYSGGFVSTVSDGTRTWNYAYANGSGGRKSLSSVTLPDGSAWTINFTPFTNAEITYNEAAFDEPLRSCTMVETPLNYSQVFVGSITHPAGGTGSFSVNIQEHGRSNVPVACGHVTTFPAGAAPGTGNNTNDDLNTFAISDNSLTLIQKQVSGPGIATATWSYAYEPGISVHRYPGTTLRYPVCNWSTQPCASPPCLSDTCAGSSKTIVSGPAGEWSRHTYGNSYRYNEGKLLKVEAGTSAANILKTVAHVYDLTLGTVTKPYPARHGDSRRVNYDGFSEEYQRPLERTETTQQQRQFTYQVDSFDSFARPVQTTRSSQPIP